MSTSVSLICLLVAALTTLSPAPGQEGAVPGPRQEDARSSKEGSSRPVVVRFERDGEVVEILCNGLEVSGRLNGKVLRPDHIVAEGAEIRIRGEADAELAVVELEPKVERFAPSEKKRVQRIGVVVQPVGQALAAQLDVETGLLVIGVEDGLPAEAAGLQVHDVVTHLQAKVPATQESLEQSVASAQAGQAIDLTVRRRGDTLELAVVPQTVEMEAVRFGWSRSLPTEQQWLLANRGVSYTLALTGPARAITVQPELQAHFPVSVGEWTIPSYEVRSASAARAGTAAEGETVEARLGKIEAHLARIEKLLEGLSEKR